MIAKLQSLSVEQKACLFILFMGVVGVVMGGLSAELEIRGCTIEPHCLLLDTVQHRLDCIGKGAFWGMGAALAASMPALVKPLK